MTINNNDQSSEKPPGMIIVQLKGGLGNQLFQYAAGRRIAIANNFSLKLDLSWFKGQPDRLYSLNHFATIKDVANPAEIARLSGSKWAHLREYLPYIRDFGKPYYQRALVRERILDFDPNILKISESTYLDGYWQSEKYFKDIEDIIRRELNVIDPPNEENVNYARLIQSSTSVAIHVRRGDYVSRPYTNRYHGVCTLDYYYRAIEYIMSAVDNPRFFIFSDDPKWAQINLKIDAPTTYVSHNTPDQNYEDLRLMTYCKHYIIANSSFSWWGAWLSQYRDKIVIAPERWFQAIDYNDEDRLPLEWIRL
jgi:hypothetical protein